MINEIYFVKHEGEWKQIHPEDIVVLQADKNYVNIVTVAETYTARATLNGIFDLMPTAMFVRINRFQAVGVNYIDTIGKDYLTLTTAPDHALGINKLYESEITDRIVLLEIPRPRGLSSKLGSGRRK